MKTKHLSKFKQRGVSLLEAMAVVALGGLIIAGVVKLMGTTSDTNSTNALSADIQAIRTNVRSYAGMSGLYGTASADITSTVSSAGGFPTSIGGSGASRTNQWQGAVTVKVGTSTNTFVISNANVPQTVCVKYLGTLDNSWASVTVGSTTITSFPIPMATSVSACSGATNTIALTTT